MDNISTTKNEKFGGLLYQTIFNRNTHFANLHALGLTLAQLQLLDKPITLNEILIAIDLLNMDKAPGHIGFTAEFYKMFTIILVLNLHKVLSSVVIKAEIPSSW